MSSPVPSSGTTTVPVISIPSGILFGDDWKLGAEYPSFFYIGLIGAVMSLMFACVSLTLFMIGRNGNKRRIGSLDGVSSLCSLLFYLFLMSDVYKYRVVAESGLILVFVWHRWVIIGLANTIAVVNYMLVMHKSFFKMLEVILFTVGGYACFALQSFFADNSVFLYLAIMGTILSLFGFFAFLISCFDASRNQKKPLSSIIDISEYSEDGVADLPQSFYTFSILPFIVVALSNIVMAFLSPAGYQVVSVNTEQIILLAFDMAFRLFYVVHVNMSGSSSVRNKGL